MTGLLAIGLVVALAALDHMSAPHLPAGTAALWAACIGCEAGALWLTFGRGEVSARESIAAVGLAALGMVPALAAVIVGAP